MTAVENFLINNQDDILPIDAADMDDVQACAAYVKEIYAYLLESEKEFCVDQNFLKRQTQFSAEDRTLLYDWISRAHSKFNLANESFFHFCALFDRILALVPVVPCDAKLLGMAVLLIASKFEQSYIPSLRHYVDVLTQEPGLRYVNCEACLHRYGHLGLRQFAALPSEEYAMQEETSQAALQHAADLPQCQQCMRAALMQAEEEILHILDFRLSAPTTLLFLRRYCKIAQMKPRDRYISFYLGELCCLSELVTVAHPPSLIAAGCVAMTRRLTRKPSWGPDLEQFSGYDEPTVRAVLTDVSSVLKQLALSPKARYVRRKYAQKDRFYAVSTLIETVVNQVVNQ